jgi:hypothetical protein
MVVQKRHPGTRLVVAEPRSDQTVHRAHLIDALRADADDRGLVLDPGEHGGDGSLCAPSIARRVSSSPSAHRRVRVGCG